MRSCASHWLATRQWLAHISAGTAPFAPIQVAMYFYMTHVAFLLRMYILITQRWVSAAPSKFSGYFDLTLIKLWLLALWLVVTSGTHMWLIWLLWGSDSMLRRVYKVPSLSLLIFTLLYHSPVMCFSLFFSQSFSVSFWAISSCLTCLISVPIQCGNNSTCWLWEI